MAENGNGNRSWFQWVLGGFLVVSMAVAGYAVQKTDSLASETIKKEQYYRDQDNTREQLRCINDKLDRLLELRK